MFSLKKLFSRTTYNPLTKELVKEYNQHRPFGPQKELCYAPFKSMYFAYEGNVTVCCYNRSNPIGKYPQKTIKQIWFGEEADKLRDYIHNNDLSLGCLGCKQHFTSRNFAGIKATECDEHTLNKNKYPSVMEFELSNLCNLECEMCNGNFSSLIRAKREKLPPINNPYDSKFVKQLEEFIPHLDEVKFYGGEPFLIEIYYEIWELIMKIKPSIRISVQTNGTVLNNRVKEILKNTNFHIGISFDSLQKETYSFIRKNADFERTLENIKWYGQYAKERNTFFGISVCAMQQNRFELPDFVKFCNELGAKLYFHTVIAPNHCSIQRLSHSELGELVKHMNSFDFPAETEIERKNKLQYADLLKQIVEWHLKSAKKIDVNSLKTIADFEALIIQHVKSDKSAAEEYKAARIKKIRENVQLISQNFSDEFFRKSLSVADVDGPFFLDIATSQLENWSKEELLARAKEFNQQL